MSEITDSASQTADWLNSLRAGEPEAASKLIEHTCERLRVLTRRMLRRFPQVQRWEETDDVFCEAAAKLSRAFETVRPESPRHFYNLAAVQLRRVLIDFARRYYGAEGLGVHHDTAQLGTDQVVLPDTKRPARKASRRRFRNGPNFMSWSTRCRTKSARSSISCGISN